MTETELQQQRAALWRVNGTPVRTIEEAKSFIDAVGFCLLYPVRSLPMLPTFIGAYAGTAEGLPAGKHAFADERTKPAIELMVRLLRKRHAYETNFHAESSLLVSAQVFPAFYSLIGDRNLQTVAGMNPQVAKTSPLAVKVFEAILKHGAVSKKQLQEIVGRESSTAALDRALNELWSILKITRVNYREPEGTYWDLLYRWNRPAVALGARISLPEAISELMGKYVEMMVAAEQEEIEQFFSVLVSRSKVREVMQALLAARELSFTTVGPKTLVQIAPVPEPWRQNG